MTALFEGGNTRLHFAWWDGNAVSGVGDIAYRDCPDSIESAISALVRTRKPDRVAACSVSPVWGGPLFNALGILYPGGVHIARTAADAGVRIKYDRPESYGIDRALAAVGAYHEVRGACVVVDAGTAVTVDAVDDEGTVIGGYIFPGGETLAHGLASRTGLPLVSYVDGENGVGTSTRTCIEHALAGGLHGAVSALVRSASAAAGGTDQIIFTGGNGAGIARALGYPDSYRASLSLTGLGLVSARLPKYA